MNKFIFLCLFFLLINNAYHSQNVTSKKSNGKQQGVITYDEAVNLIRTSEKKKFVFALFHSKFCKYCKLVISFLEQNANIEYINEEKWINNKGNLLNTSPIVIFSKNIHKENKDKVTPFFDELYKKTKKVQVPALQIGDRILFESKDIIKFLNFVLDYLGLQKLGAQNNLKNRVKKMDENFLNMESKIDSNKKNKRKEDDEEEEEEEEGKREEGEEGEEGEEEEEEEEEEGEEGEEVYENEDVEIPKGGNCGFNMNTDADLLLKLLQNKEVLSYLNNLALSILNQQGQMGEQVPVDAASEEFEECKKCVKKSIKKNSKKNGTKIREGNVRKSNRA